MFRCPGCGQGKQLTFRGTRREELVLTMEDSMEKVLDVFHKHTAYRDGAEEKYIKMFEKNQEQNCQCGKCQKVHTLAQWREAKVDSLKYLEMEDGQLCHCGGELWMDKVPGTNSFGFVCDKCDWVKPNKKVSGQ